MKKRSLSISISEPCHEDWSEMTPVEQGRFCLSCQKKVVDFTQMPKVKIAEYVSNNSGNMCGRFSADQLNVELLPPKPSKTWMKYAAIILGLIPTLSYGQEQVKPKVEDIEQEPSFPILGDIDIQLYEKQKEAKELHRISNDAKKGIPASRKLNTAPEIKSLRQAPSNPEKKSILIDGQPVAISSEDSYDEDMLQALFPTVEIVSLKQEFTKGKMVGSYAVVTSQGLYGVMEEKKGNWLKRQWKKFKILVKISHEEAIENREIEKEALKTTEENSSIEVAPSATIVEDSFIVDHENPVQPQIKVYPNPTSSFVNIEMPMEVNNGVVQISNMNNELIQTETFSTNSVTMDISSLVSGSYLVSIIVGERLIKSEMIVKI